MTRWISCRTGAIKSPRRSTDSLVAGARNGVATTGQSNRRPFGAGAFGSRLRGVLRRLWFSAMYWLPRPPPWDTGVTPPELERFVASHQPGRALDLGCGTGTNVVYVARHGWDAVGIDFAGRAIAKARRRARDAGVSAKFLVDDVTRLEVAGPFDLALDLGCLQAIPVGG